MKNLKIGTQIILATFAIVLIAIFGTAATSTYFLRNYITDATREDALQGLYILKNSAEMEMQKVRSFRDHIEQNAVFAMHMANHEREALLNDMTSLMQGSGVDVMVAALPDGTVIARGNNREKYGDYIGDDEIVKRALKGEEVEMMMSGPSSKLGYYCATPIKRSDGQIVGMIRVAMSFERESFLDQIKAVFGNEFTVFAGKTRINTTILENGKRVTGTDASEAVQQIVLRDGKDYLTEIELFGKAYLGAYSPIKDPSSGKIVGMYFGGQSLETA
ncbi:MAG: cache domain-containing protein, partial [Synergistaceae bacterium]|nr:cache domain-containing protein [Synergistaceae bacterium]